MQASQRNSGTVSDFSITLPRILERVSRKSRFSIQILDTTVPFSFYQLSADINTVQVRFTDSVGNTKTINVTLQAGNYNALNILTELSSKLTTAAQSSSGSYTGFTPVFNFTYSTTTGKHTLSMTSPANTEVLIYFSLNTNFGRFFGFTNNATISPTSTAVSDKMVCTNPICNLYLRCGNLRQLGNREYIVENAVFSDIVYVLPVGSQQMTYISSNHQGEELILSDDNISTLNFYITSNLNYTPLDLQGLDNFAFSFTIRERAIPEIDMVQNDLLESRIPALLSTPQPMPQIEYKPTEEELDLMRKRDRILKKLNKYKDKISSKIKGKENDVEEDVLQPEQPTSVFSQLQASQFI